MARKRVGKFPPAFRRMALERLKVCENVTVLAKELGVDRTLLYKWRDQELGKDGVTPGSRERELRKQVQQLKRLLAEKTLEVDFFKGSLQKIEARRRSSSGSGGKASTTRSGK